MILNPLALAAAQLLAAVVLEVSLSDMLRAAELVFEGEVTGIETPKPSGHQPLRTYVTFAVSEVIKGDASLTTVELAFLGGTAGEMTLRVADMSLPKLGESGIYFVESLGRHQVHPLYGWSQGHFVVVRDQAGMRRVVTADGQAVVALKPPKRAVTHPQLSSGAARGLVLRGPAEVSSALSAGEFKRALADMLQPR